MEVKFIGIEDKGAGPAAVFDTGYIYYDFDSKGRGVAVSNFCLLRETLVSRIQNIKKHGGSTSEEELGLNALYNYSKVTSQETLK